MPDRTGRQNASDWANMKINDAGRYPEIWEASFHSIQLELPLDFTASSTETCGEFQSVRWRSPYNALGDYLAAVGVDNPNKVARVLLDEFGSLSDLLAGSWWRLRCTVGSRLAAVIRSSRELMQVALSERLPERPIVPGSNHLRQFLRIHVGFLTHERLMAIYVDGKMRLLRIQKIADGSVSCTDANMSRILRCGLSVGATGILLVHNHPSGIPTPSDSDVHLTERIRKAAALLDMWLLDHLIIARDRVGTIHDFWLADRWKAKS